MVRINTKTRMTHLRRVRRILISSKDVTGVASEKSDAVKFASQAKLKKNVKMERTKPYASHKTVLRSVCC